MHLRTNQLKKAKAVLSPLSTLIHLDRLELTGFLFVFSMCQPRWTIFLKQKKHRSSSPTFWNQRVRGALPGSPLSTFAEHKGTASPLSADLRWPSWVGALVLQTLQRTACKINETSRVLPGGNDKKPNLICLFWPDWAASVVARTKSAGLRANHDWLPARPPSAFHRGTPSAELASHAALWLNQDKLLQPPSRRRACWWLLFRRLKPRLGIARAPPWVMLSGGRFLHKEQSC